MRGRGCGPLFRGPLGGGPRGIPLGLRDGRGSDGPEQGGVFFLRDDLLQDTAGALRKIGDRNDRGNVSGLVFRKIDDAVAALGVAACIFRKLMPAKSILQNSARLDLLLLTFFT